MADEGPLKKKKVAEVKKPRNPFSKGVARTILKCKGAPDVAWLQREVEQMCREHCLPMSLVGNDFMTHLGTLFEATAAQRILENLRLRYKTSHPFSEVLETADAELASLPLKEVESESEEERT